MHKKHFILFFIFSLLYFTLVRCKNNDGNKNTYSLIINIDSLEFYKHPLKTKTNLKISNLSNFNAKEFIRQNGIKKQDSVLIKMLEGAECIPKAINILISLRKEDIKNIRLRKFDIADSIILGYENFILFDSTKSMQLSVPTYEK